MRLTLFAFKRPFRSHKFEVEVSNQVVPCELDFEFRLFAFGYNGDSTLAYWTPPSCIVTTTPATTTTTFASTTTSYMGTAVTTTDVSVRLEALQGSNI